MDEGNRSKVKSTNKNPFNLQWCDAFYGFIDIELMLVHWITHREPFLGLFHFFFKELNVFYYFFLCNLDIFL